MEASASASSSTVRNMIGLPYPAWMGSIVLVLFYVVKPVFQARVWASVHNRKEPKPAAHVTVSAWDSNGELIHPPWC
jgi:hypothetical protein